MKTAPTISPEDELARVMAEITQAFRGAGAALTQHPIDRPAHVVHADGDEEMAQIVTGLAQSGVLIGPLEQADELRWITGDFGSHAPQAIVLPVRQVAGHARLAVTVWFSTLDAARRAAVEAVYLQRRPIAVGYFRLWQLERVHGRKMASLRFALDLFDTGVLLVAKSGSIVFANAAARALLDANAGISEHNGQLRASGLADNVTLAMSLAHIVDAGEQSNAREVPLFTIKRKSASPLIIAVLPPPAVATDQAEVAALVFVVDTDLDIRDHAQSVCQVLGFTPVETRLACELADGLTLEEAATKLRVKKETARSYLRAIFTKTGVNRQADLVRLILTSLVRASVNRRVDKLAPQL